MGTPRLKILCLGYKENIILDFFAARDYNLLVTDNKISLGEIKDFSPDWIVSYGYRYIVGAPVIEEYRNRIINLHISYIPWNRGVSPNLWSFLEDTPKGVTIHYLDEGIDTGDILRQKKVTLSEDETLATSYTRLRREIETLFIDVWPSIADETIIPQKQDLTVGSYHSLGETNEIIARLNIDDWNMGVKELMTRKTDDQIIGEIQEIRSRNNTHWMDVVRLAFKLAPEEARSIFKKIKQCDHDINELLQELADNDME